MSIRFSQLASGSSGNSGLLHTATQSVLIDIGLGPQLLASRFRVLGAHIRNVRGVILTHTHGDHWKQRTLALLVQQKIPLYCHEDHVLGMGFAFTEIENLRSAGLLRLFRDGESFRIADNIQVRPFLVSHDSRPTFGFRLEEYALFGPTWSMAYASDIGSWGMTQMQAMSGVDLLAIEFNHDEALERRSRRPAHLVNRVLGDEGHLSNKQASEFVQAILQMSPDSNLKHLVLLHLSQECNRPHLARLAANEALLRGQSLAQVHIAEQDRVLPWMDLTGKSRANRVTQTPRPEAQQSLLNPGE